VKRVEEIDARPAMPKAKEAPVSSRSEDEVFWNFAKLRARVDAMKNIDKHDS